MKAFQSKMTNLKKIKTAEDSAKFQARAEELRENTIKTLKLHFPIFSEVYATQIDESTATWLNHGNPGVLFSSYGAPAILLGLEGDMEVIFATYGNSSNTSLVFFRDYGSHVASIACLNSDLTNLDEKLADRLRIP